MTDTPEHLRRIAERLAGSDVVSDAMVATIHYAADEIELLHRMASPRGCICPPTSEQTCKSPMCPRRGFEGML